MIGGFVILFYLSFVCFVLFCVLRLVDWGVAVDVHVISLVWL